jgi:hypothetical protein
MAALFVALAVFVAAAPRRSRAADEPAKLRVLIFSGLNNHDWKSTTPVIKKALQECARFGVVDVTDHPAAIDAAKLAGYDVIVSTLGHDAGAMQAGFRTLLLRSAEWAATDRVTIPVPAIWPSTPTAMTAADIDQDAALAGAARYDHGRDRQPLWAVQQLVVYANSLGADDASGFRSRLADRLVVLLKSADATAAAKAFACGQLADLAAAAHAPALAALLTDKKVAAPSLAALARIPGPAADQLLREALKTAAGELQIGVVNALGERRDRGAVDALSGLVSGGDAALACAAASALGKIGGEAAAAALQKSLSARPAARCGGGGVPAVCRPVAGGESARCGGVSVHAAVRRW